jgi:hypothetical protein
MIAAQEARVTTGAGGITGIAVMAATGEEDHPAEITTVVNTSVDKINLIKSLQSQGFFIFRQWKSIINTHVITGWWSSKAISEPGKPH